MKIIIKRMISVAIAVLLIASSLTSCGGSSNKKREVTINVNPTGFEHIAMLIAQEQGLFEKYMPEGVTIKYTSITSGTEQRDTLVSGQIDFAGLAVPYVATALQNDFPIAYVTYMGCNLFQMFARDESIQSIADLNSSHKISVPSIGTNPHTVFLLTVQADGRDMSEFDNSMITMTNSDAITALISGTEGVDAVISTFPTLLAAWQSDNIHLIKDFTDEIAEYGVGNMLCTRQEFIEENPDIVDAVLQAFNEAVDIIINDPETAIQIMMEVYDGCDHDTAEKTLEFYVNVLRIGTGKYDKLMASLYELGILEQPAELFENIPKYEADE